MNIDLQMTRIHFQFWISWIYVNIFRWLSFLLFYIQLKKNSKIRPITALSSWITNFVDAEWTSNLTHNFTLIPAEIQIEDPYSIVSRHLQLFKRVTEERLCHRAVLSICYDRETSLIVNDQATVLTLIHTTWRNRHKEHSELNPAVTITITNKYLSCHTRHVKLILKEVNVHSYYYMSFRSVKLSKIVPISWIIHIWFHISDIKDSGTIS